MFGTGLLMIILGLVTMAYVQWGYDLYEKVRAHPLSKRTTFILGGVFVVFGVAVAIWAKIANVP